MVVMKSQQRPERVPCKGLGYWHTPLTQHVSSAKLCEERVKRAYRIFKTYNNKQVVCYENKLLGCPLPAQSMESTICPDPCLQR